MIYGFLDEAEWNLTVKQKSRSHSKDDFTKNSKQVHAFIVLLIRVGDVGDDTAHWESFGNISQQGGPQSDRRTTSYKE